MKARVLVLVLLVVFGLISGGCGSDQVADPGPVGSPGTSSSVSEETIGSSTAPSLGSPTELILGSFEVCPDGIHIGQIAPAEGVTCEAVCEVLGFGGCEYRAGQADTDTCLPTDPTQSGECTDVFKPTWSSQCRCSDGLSTPDPTVALEFPATFQGTGEFYMEAYAEFGSEGSVTGGSPVEVEIVLEADGYARATITYHIATLWECIQGDRYGNVSSWRTNPPPKWKEPTTAMGPSYSSAPTVI